MTNLDTESSSVTITIGHITVQLICDHPKLTRDLLYRYRGYANLHVSDLDFISIIKVRDIHHVDAHDEIYVENGKIHLRSRTREGAIDLERGAGRLSVGKNDTLEGIDYFLRVLYALLVFREGGILFHAAGISDEGIGYVFFGHSGSGKSTIARFSSGKRVLNDDLVVLLKEKGVWTVFSTPFWNDVELNPDPTIAKLAGMYQLVKGKQVGIEKLSKGAAIAEMLSCTPVLSVDPLNIQKLIHLHSDIFGAVPVYRLTFLPDDSYWRVIRLHRTPNSEF